LQSSHAPPPCLAQYLKASHFGTIWENMPQMVKDLPAQFTNRIGKRLASREIHRPFREIQLS
jgi:hypothetical protein